ncbi:LPS assembly lipoprotein LptE [Planctomicrobium sp. SH668]|uniref:LPS assembly lipoprotein LptE n=1 Tax=Planctomicrobium sp. SH668 TaxID=3448126 RepID=UPI003F5AF46C
MFRSSSTQISFTRRLALWSLVCLSGCGYVVGSPYRTELRTIHVPTFRNDAFQASYTNDGYRRGFELQLTEAVQKRIQTATPFRLTKSENADTRLTGRVVNVSKGVVNQNKYDDPRELELNLGVEIVWEDLKSGQVLAQSTVPIDAQVAQAVVNTSFAPETGQSLATATQSAVDQMARKIVGMMEMPW